MLFVGYRVCDISCEMSKVLGSTFECFLYGPNHLGHGDYRGLIAPTQMYFARM